jgi:hypothetical protein
MNINRMKVKPMLAAGLAVGLIAAGCGDDDDSESASITKDEWIAQASEICSQSEQAMEEQAGEFFRTGKPEPKAELEFQTEVVVPGIREQVTQIAALPVPEGDEGEIEAIVTTAEDGLEEAEEDPTVVEESSGALAEAGRLISDYGVKACG